MTYWMVLVHDHECSHEGERLVVSQLVKDGVVQVVPMICVETQSELRIAVRWTEDR